MGNYFSNEDAEPQINKIIAADGALFTTITFPWLLSSPPLICSTTLNRWPDEELSVNTKRSKHWAQKCQRQILLLPFPKPAWVFPELAYTLDECNVELGGWDRAEQVLRVLHVPRGFPGRTFCCGSPTESIAEGWRPLLSWADTWLWLRRVPSSPCCAGILLKKALAQFRGCQVQLSVAKPVFQLVQTN